MKSMKRLLVLLLCIIFFVPTNLNVLAADGDTYVYIDNTDLEREEIKYEITIPVAMELVTTDNADTLSENSQYKSHASILITGNGVVDDLTISAASKTVSDSGNAFTLTTEDGDATENDTFRIGDVSGITSYTLTEDDFDAVTGVGLEIEVAIEDVTNANTIEVYEGGLAYTFSIDMDVVQELGTPGLYDVDNNLICTYEDLVDVYDMQVDKVYTATTCKTDVQSPYYVLTNNPELATGTKLALGDDLSFIGAYAFSECDMLEYVKIPTSAVTISTYAFYKNAGLKHVKIPSSIISIEASAFELCTSLETVIVPDSVTSIGDRVFFGCSNLYKALLGDGHSSVGAGLFTNCTSLYDVRLSKNLRTLPLNMFKDCVSLEDIPECSVVTIGESVFEGCTGFEKIIVPNSITSLGARAFAGCTEMKYIELPDGLTAIDLGSQFNSCRGLTTIYIPASVSSMARFSNGTSPFVNCLSGLKIYCGADSKPSGWVASWNYYNDNSTLETVFGVTRDEYYEIIGR